LQGLDSLVQIGRVPLELRIQELVKLIQKEKEKIVQAYLHFAPEKELLRKLIISH